MKYAYMLGAIGVALLLGISPVFADEPGPQPKAPDCVEKAPPCPPKHTQKPQLMNKSEGPVVHDTHITERVIIHREVVELPLETQWVPGNPVYQKPRPLSTCAPRCRPRPSCVTRCRPAPPPPPPVCNPCGPPPPCNPCGPQAAGPAGYYQQASLTPPGMQSPARGPVPVGQQTGLMSCMKDHAIGEVYQCPGRSATGYCECREH